MIPTKLITEEWQATEVIYLKTLVIAKVSHVLGLNPHLTHTMRAGGNEVIWHALYDAVCQCYYVIDLI